MSDLAAYRRLLVRRAPIILGLSFLLAAAAYAATRSIGPTYEVRFSYLISLAEQQPTPDFQFDGYYALQATDLFSATLATWATAPEVVVAAYQAAGLEVSASDAQRLVRAVTAEKTAPQLVQVTVRAKDAATAERLGVALREVMARNIDLYHQQGIPALTFRAIATTPWTIERPVATTVITVATFLTAAILITNGLLLWESLKVEDRSAPPAGGWRKKTENSEW